MLRMFIDSTINRLCIAVHVLGSCCARPLIHNQWTVQCCTFVVVYIGAELEGSLPSFVNLAIRGL
jgi:hypothetical protein